MTTPSITPAQIVALLQPLLAFLVAFGIPMTETQTNAILGLSGTISTALIVADMFIRRARANNATAIASAQYINEPPPARAFVLHDGGE